ncbi:MAG: hypothetical protein PHH16_03780 [Candidatus Gracilibacteria bacterium]|nr:hypothetical protein [Candidatus Gracilibacteria bacterium]
MFKGINSRGNVFLYAMMLSFFAVIIGYIIVVKMDTLMENLDIQNYDTKLHSNLTEKADLAIGYDLSLNTDGSGFTNTIKCPDSVTMSGTLAGGTLENIATVPFFSNTAFVCSGSTAKGNLLITYSSGGTVFVTGSYLGSNIALQPAGGTGARTGTFSDGSGTYISFTATGTFSNLDLDRNSDNFQTFSTGTIAYPNGFLDNDDLARRTIYGYIKKDTGWYNSFTMNTPIRKYIAGNTLNIASSSVMAGDTQTGYLRLDIDNPYNIKIVEFDRARFESIQELRVSTGSTASFSTGGIGWIMPDLSLSGSAGTGSRRVFDLKNKDYALYLSFSGNLTNTGVDFLKYKITMENENGTGVYITPIDDSTNGIIKYLGTDSIIDRDNDYRYKQFEVVRENTIVSPLNNGCFFGIFFGSGCSVY